MENETTTMEKQFDEKEFEKEKMILERLITAKHKPAYAPDVHIMTKEDLAVLRLKECLEAILKQALYQLRTYELRYGLRIEYATRIGFNEYNLPYLIIEILKLEFKEPKVPKKQEKEEKQQQQQ